MPFFTAPGHSEYRAHRGGSSYDEDSARLPDNMVRCGYDADTQRYYFRDTTTNEIWEGNRGTYYGHMTRVGGSGGGQRQSGGTELVGGRKGRWVVEDAKNVESGYGYWEDEWKRSMKSIWEKERNWEKEVGGDGLKVIAEAVVSKLSKKVDMWRARHDGRNRHEPRGHALVRKLTTTRHSKGVKDRAQSTGRISASRQASDTSTLNLVEGKEMRLTLIAAGVKRTIFDAV